MKVTEKSKSSFQLKQVNLRRSEFRMETSIQSTGEYGILIETNRKRYGKNDRTLECTLSVTLQFKKEIPLHISVTMAGQFYITGEMDFSVNEFLDINAPSIIYPYIRQHIRTLSLEAGIKPIILPVLNFVTLKKNNN